MTVHACIPYLSVSNATAAIDFYSRVFGTPPHVILEMPDGRVMHGEFRIGETRFYFSDELPEHGGTPSPASLRATTVALHLEVDACDEFVERMRANGAEVLMEPEDMFWGERFARVRDPFGHEWGIATRLREMSAGEITAAAAALFESHGSSEQNEPPARS